jgi:hypothetical protein
VILCNSTDYLGASSGEPTTSANHIWDTDKWHKSHQEEEIRANFDLIKAKKSIQ